jgi:A/G-specific adenine glycosylase
MIGTPSEFARRLLRWYRANRRDLPWRLPMKSAPGEQLNPYYVLVSEAMLQQTQVATVIPYFNRFVSQFPTVAALADAQPQQVLRAWQGLGYYSRARNLQAAARKIVAEHSGVIPAKVEQLLELPGIGRYTAGAVASIAFEQRAPILDGNVARVLCRIDAIQGDPRETKTRDRLWQRAEEILPKRSIGDFNSALMELGALVCTPKSPSCLLCPVRQMCGAFAAGLVDQIPPPRKAKATPLVDRWTFCIRDGDRYLVQQRPASGRWAGMWQFATIPATSSVPSVDLLQSQFSLQTSKPVLLGSVAHALTHRRYQFEVFACENLGTRAGEWASLPDLESRPMPKPHLKIREMLSAMAEKSRGGAGPRVGK